MNDPTKENPNTKSSRKNYFYNLAYQMFALFAPLIVTPYISRVLGSSGVGQYSFTYSIATYFVLLASLGFGYYAQREIAGVQSDKKRQSLVFYEILISRFISVLVSLLIYFVLLLSGVYGEAYSTLMWILSINIVATAFDVTFLFQGNEEFGIIALRNVVIKIIGIVVILVFVKDESHVWLYAFCQSLILIVSNLSLWPRLPKMLVRVDPKQLNIRKHLVPTLRLFIPTVAISVYTVLDKTLIGTLIPGTVQIDGVEKKISDIENGYYDHAEKIVKMAMTIITSLGTVMIPRNSKTVSSGNFSAFKNNIQNALRFVMFLGIPIMFGVIATTSNFSPWFFGPGYEKVPILMMILSPLVVIIGLSNVIGLQYLIPLKKDKKYTAAIIIGAIVNLSLNLFFIPLLWSYGAAIATVSAELIITAVMFWFSRNDIKPIDVFFVSWKYLLSGTVMFGVVFFTQVFMTASVLNTILLVLEGCVTYLTLLILLKDRWFLENIRRVFGKMKGFLKKKEK